MREIQDAIRAAGLTPPDIIEPGRFYRFPGEGKRDSNRAGWCKLFDDGMGGVFGDFSSGLEQAWRADIGRPFTLAEEAGHRAKVAAMRHEREAEEARRHLEAARKAAAIWGAAPPAPEDHAYLSHKRIEPHGARLHRGALLIPVRVGGQLHSLQFIEPEGEKRFLTGGRVAGCYFSIGDPKGAAALCIAEGFATGATIHQATGYPVAIAFNAGNLQAVAKTMRARYADLPLILCADDDSGTDGNPGLTKATEAARAVGGLLAIPDFGRVAA